MNLIGQDILLKAGRKNTPLRKVLTEWAAVVQADGTQWTSLNDLRQTYPSADGVALVSGTVVTAFNLKGTSYRLISWIDYESATVEALEVLTHAEYNKDLWKGRY